MCHLNRQLVYWAVKAHFPGVLVSGAQVHAHARHVIHAHGLKLLWRHKAGVGIPNAV